MDGLVLVNNPQSVYCGTTYLRDMFALYKFRRGDSQGSDWDRKYAEEPSADLEHYRAQPFVRTILRSLPVRSRILDAGCGTGGLLRFLKQRGSDVVGVDSSRVAIETLRRLTPDIPAQVASIERLPFPDASFDAYLAIGSWEYPADGPQRAAAEAVRVLRPGGLAFIEVPHANFVRRLLYLPLKRLEHTVRSRRSLFSHHLFSRPDMRALLRGNRFEILEEHPHDLPEPTRHYGLWVDWPILRGGPHYELNALGRWKKRVLNAISPWTIATGMFIVARKLA